MSWLDIMYISLPSSAVRNLSTSRLVFETWNASKGDFVGSFQLELNEIGYFTSARRNLHNSEWICSWRDLSE